MDKTILISSGRCGSQLICQSLKNAGYNVIGEPILNSWDKLIYKDIATKYTNLETFDIQKLQNPQYILDCFERCDMMSILYYAISPELEEFINNSKIKIVHLKRKNQLLRYLSLKHAQQTNHWDNLTIDNQKISLNIKDIINNINYVKEQEKKYSGLDVYYEDIVANDWAWRLYINKILEYCGEKPLDKIIPKIGRKVITKHPLDLSNLEELALIPELKSYVDMCDPYFSQDVFSSRISMFRRYLSEFIDKKAKCLEIGSLEGRSAHFTLNFLPDSTLTIYTINPPETQRILELNLRKYSKDNRVVINNTWSNALRFETQKFDFIYVDGSHERLDVLRDAVLAFEVLKSGGIMIFDDYGWSKNDETKIAIDNFIECYQSELQVLTNYTDYCKVIKKL